MHKPSTHCFPHRSGQQRGTGHCHCGGGAGPPDFSPPSHLPPPPLPQAPTRPGEKPSPAMLGRSAIPRSAAGLTPTGRGCHHRDPALPGHSESGCMLPSLGCAWGREGRRDQPPARRLGSSTLGRGNLKVLSQAHRRPTVRTARKHSLSQ